MGAEPTVSFSLPARPVPEPTETEILANLLLGPQAGGPALGSDRPGGLRRALDEVLTAALSRPPCLVSFSGGRDSSAVLALACDTARRTGLALPIPAIMRFPGVASSDEQRWQELVMAHLGVTEHEVVTLTDQVDALGPAATRFMRRHGVRWPGNAHMHAPMLELARGGTILTGIGGDELFETRIAPRRARAVAYGALPRPVRAAVDQVRRPIDGYRWLTPEGRRRVARVLARERARHLHRWGPALGQWYGSRSFAALTGTIALLGSDYGVTVVNPLLHPLVLAEIRPAAGERGFPTRAAGLDWLAGPLLPGELIRRESKAVFNAPLWGPETRSFVAGWDGSGTDPRWVDRAALVNELSRPEPDARTMLLVQSIWLAGDRG